VNPITIPQTPHVLRRPDDALPEVTTIGIDPGKNGALVILRPGLQFAGAVAWKSCTWQKRPAFEVTRYTAAGRVTVTKVHSWWDVVRGIPRCADAAVVEAVYGQPGKSGFEVLAEHAGRALAWCEALEIEVIGRPASTGWRADVLLLEPQTSADLCEKVALNAFLDRPTSGRSITIRAGIRNRPPVEVSGHVAEAALMAAWGMGYRLVRAEP
jgi:hypothetical protein